MTEQKLGDVFSFYRDLGITKLYRRPGKPVEAAAPRQAAKEAGMKAPVPDVVLPLAPAHDNLLKIVNDIGNCKRCRLHEGRNKIVFGSGSDKAALVFVGEGPGADE